MQSSTFIKIKKILSEGSFTSHPLEGHPYHSKSEDQLKFIIKDAGEAAEAMRNHNSTAESKYLDQVNDAVSVLHWRKKNGTPEWYKNKYLKKQNESVEELEELSKETLSGYMDKALKQSIESGAEKISGKSSTKKPRWKGIEKANVKFWKKVK